MLHKLDPRGDRRHPSGATPTLPLFRNSTPLPSNRISCMLFLAVILFCLLILGITSAIMSTTVLSAASTIVATTDHSFQTPLLAPRTPYLNSNEMRSSTLQEIEYDRNDNESRRLELLGPGMSDLDEDGDRSSDRPVTLEQRPLETAEGRSEPVFSVLADQLDPMEVSHLRDLDSRPIGTNEPMPEVQSRKDRRQLVVPDVSDLDKDGDGMPDRPIVFDVRPIGW